MTECRRQSTEKQQAEWQQECSPALCVARQAPPNLCGQDISHPFPGLTKKYTNNNLKNHRTRRTRSRLNGMVWQPTWKEQFPYYPGMCLFSLVLSARSQCFTWHARGHDSTTHTWPHLGGPTVLLRSLQFNIPVSAIRKRKRAISCSYIINHNSLRAQFLWELTMP